MRRISQTSSQSTTGESKSVRNRRITHWQRWKETLFIFVTKMQEIMYKFESSTNPTLRHNVCKFKQIGMSGIGAVCKLWGTTRWPFVHENKFLDQGKKRDKMFVFKMSKIGHDSRVDLVQKI